MHWLPREDKIEEDIHSRNSPVKEILRRICIIYFDSFEMITLSKCYNPSCQIQALSLLQLQ